jgi:peptidoglycan/LPS O-acetylase OafA/YrhL
MVLTTYKLHGLDGVALQFGLRRLIRIVPLYWAATLALLLIDHRYSAGMVIKSLLFLPTDAHPWVAGGYFPVLVVGWTLHIEMLFYLIFTIALLLSRRFVYPAIAGAILVLASLDHLISSIFPITAYYLTTRL